MFVIKYKKIFLAFSLTMVLLSFVSIFRFGLPLGIDFKGGSILEVEYKNTVPQNDVIKTSLNDAGFSDALIQVSGKNGVIVKTHATKDDAERQSLVKAMGILGKEELTVKKFDAIGPSIGKELARKAWLSIIAVIVAIILFIAFAFRGVSKPVSSWKYGIIAIITLAHDVIIPVGLFSLLAHYRGAEVDTLFVVALLTILGLSVNDTIVVFDRIRENLNRKISKNFEETVGKSLSQTFVRSINTSFTIIIVLISLFIFGPETTKNFALMLATGLVFGTYSSIFLASPMLTIVEKRQRSN